MATFIDLDHIAVAVEQKADAVAVYGGTLGGRPVAGGPGYGFWWEQFAYAAGMRVEVLEPYQPHVNDFLRRFLDRNGPGPHHMTFTVPDLAAALDRAAALGYRPVHVDLSDPTWKEAFLHPKDAPGIVIQLAEAEDDHEPPPDELTDIPSLVRVTHAVADLQDGVRLFADLLQGEEQEATKSEQGRTLDLGWAGGGVVRLLQPRSRSDAAAWLSSRRGRVHHIAFSGPSLDDAVIPPDENLGTRLVLTKTAETE